MQEAITRDPEVMHGIPVFRGTRVPVRSLFDYLENGDSLDDFLEGFPQSAATWLFKSLRSLWNFAWRGPDANSARRVYRPAPPIAARQA